MSDLAATNCGCGCEENNGGFFRGGDSCNCIITLLILSCLCGNGGWGNMGCGNGRNDNSCMLLLVLLFCCGGCGF